MDRANALVRAQLGRRKQRAKTLGEGRPQGDARACHAQPKNKKQVKYVLGLG